MIDSEYNLSMKPKAVILICADAEWNAIIQLVPGAKVSAAPYGDYFFALLNNRIPIDISQEGETGDKNAIPVVFLHTGWGKIGAAGATQFAIDQWQPHLLVNLGTCGGFEGSIQAGEILLVDRTVVYDILEQMGDYDAHIAHYTCVLDYGWLSEPYPQAVLRTLLVSGDRDLVVEDLPQLKQRYGAVAGDWESGAIAFVAQRNSVRLLILRGVTDLVGPGGGEAYGNPEIFRQATRGIMQRLLEFLPQWVEQGIG